MVLNDRSFLRNNMITKEKIKKDEKNAGLYKYLKNCAVH